MTPEQDAAIALLAKIVAVQPDFDDINKRLRPLFGDFAPSIEPISDCVAKEVIALADAVLGDGLASYFLYECQPTYWREEHGGCITTADGRQWPILTVEDLVAYLRRDDACPCSDRTTKEPRP